MSKKKRRRKSSSHKSASRSRRNRPMDSPISLCMIVRNEEHFLEGCIESVRHLVGEIVIVDTGSTDRTIEIAKHYRAKVFNFRWEDDFAAARNFALRNCNSPWILYLDADERLPEQFHIQILKAIKSNDADAYYLKIYSPVSGILGNVSHEQAYPRLFKKRPGVKFEGKIHEQITPSLKRTNARFGHLNARIEHLGYAQDNAILKEKIRRNLAYLQKQVKKEPGDAYALFQLGQTLLLDNRRKEGMARLREALETRMLPNNLTATTLLMLANEHFKAEEIETALEYIDKSLTTAPRQRLGYFLQSECLAKQGRWQEAVTALEKLNENKKITYSELSIEKNFDDYLVSQRSGLYLYQSGDYQKAFEKLTDYFRQAEAFRTSLLQKWSFAWQTVGSPAEPAHQFLELFSPKIELFDNRYQAAKLLAGVAEKLGSLHHLNHYLKICLNHNPADEVALFYMGNVALEQGALSKAEHYFCRAMENNDRVWEIHYNLVVTMIKRNRYDRAVQILENALKQFPEKKDTARRLLAGLYAKMQQYDKVMDYVQPMDGE